MGYLSIFELVVLPQVKHDVTVVFVGQVRIAQLSSCILCRVPPIAFFQAYCNLQNSLAIYCDNSRPL